MTTIVIADDAATQLASIADWWRVNRPAAPTLPIDELEECLRLLESSPDAGPRFLRTSVPGVRRIALRRSKHFVYYVHDPANAVVYVIAVWGAPRMKDPDLVDPR